MMDGLLSDGWIAVGDEWIVVGDGHGLLWVMDMDCCG